MNVIWPVLLIHILLLYQTVFANIIKNFINSVLKGIGSAIAEKLLYDFIFNPFGWKLYVRKYEDFLPHETSKLCYHYLISYDFIIRGLIIVSFIGQFLVLFFDTCWINSCLCINNKTRNLIIIKTTIAFAMIVVIFIEFIDIYIKTKCAYFNLPHIMRDLRLLSSINFFIFIVSIISGLCSVYEIKMKTYTFYVTKLIHMIFAIVSLLSSTVLTLYELAGLFKALNDSKNN